MQATDLVRLTITEVAEQIRAKHVSPVELTRAYLERIERHNPKLNAYVTVTADAALAEARAAEQEIAGGAYRGPLHGVPIGLKDLYATRGVRTAAGSKILGEWVPDEDATTTAKLRQAGAVLLGKLNTHEFAYGVTTNNPYFGPTRNPWDTDRIPGGSSGGSGAAVAADLAPLAMGTDTGGSIRIPASLCGTVGFKATHGRVSTYGIVPLSWSLDHAGPLTHTVQDAAIAMNVLAGYDPRDSMTAPVPVPDFTAGIDAGVRGLRLGVPRTGFCDSLDPEVAAAFEAALAVFRGLGATVEDMELPVLVANRSALGEILLAEARHYHAASLRDRPGDIGEDVLSRLNRRTDMSAEELVDAFRQRDAASRETAELLERFDALLTPTTRIPAPGILKGQTIVLNGEEVFAPNVLTTNTAPFNFTGTPALSLPCGFTASGLPIGLQIAGRRWDEPTVLRIGHAYERATPWHTRRPEL
ncbi:MAG: amidase [Dehalococcoidia bacterium]